MNWGNLADILSGLLSAAAGLNSSFVSLGLGILAVSFLLEAVGLVLNYWLRGGAQEVIARGLRLLIITSIPLAALGSWPQMSGYITNFFQRDMTAPIGIGGSGVQSISNAANGLFNAMTAVGNALKGAGSDTPPPASGATGTPLKSLPVCNQNNPGQGNCVSGTQVMGPNGQTLPTCNAHTGLANCVSSSGIVYGASGATATAPQAVAAQNNDSFFGLGRMIKDLVISVVVGVIIGIPALILSLAGIFALYGPLLMLAIGVIVGPILIAWLPWEPMSNFATTWLKYMITMGVSFVVGLVMMKISTNIITQLANTIANNMAAGNDSILGAIAGMFVVASAMLFMAFMMLKTEHIGAALVGGPSVGGGGAFGGMLINSALRMGRGGGKKSDAPSAGNKSGGQSSAGTLGPTSGGAAAGSAGGGRSSAANLSAGAGAAASRSATSPGGPPISVMGGLRGFASEAAAVARESFGSPGAAAKTIGRAAVQSTVWAATSQSSPARTLRSAAKLAAIGAGITAGPVGIVYAAGAIKGGQALVGSTRAIIRGGRSLADNLAQRRAMAAHPEAPTPASTFRDVRQTN